MSYLNDITTANNVSDIKAKTDNLPSDPADQSLLEDDHNTIIGNQAVMQSNDTNPGIDDVTNIRTRDVVGNKLDTTAGTSLVSMLKKLINYSNVPSADDAANSFIRDVVGNKSDTISGDSLIALAKIISLTKIGDTSDSHGLTTLFARLKTLIEHIHSAARCYPSLANPIQLTCGSASAWDLGTIVEIVPVNTITSDFDFHWGTISDLTANADYELHLYKGLGGAEVFAGCVPFQKTNNFTQEGSIGMMTELFPANTRISAAIASSSGNADTCKVKLQYHTY